MKLVWQKVVTDNINQNDIETWRAKVPGGWLVSTWASKSRADAGGKSVPGGSNWGGGVTFVPDPRGKWDVEIEE